jgi:excisionase family DNA binding protein
MPDDIAQSKSTNLAQPDFSTVKETAQRLRLCEKQIRRLVSQGELPAYRFGAALRIRRKDIDVYVEAQRI